MNVSDEIRRLDQGPRPDEEAGGIGPIAIAGLCDGDADQVVKRCREVLRNVLLKDSAHRPSLDEWRSCLPRWFVKACAPEGSHEEVERELAQWRAMPPEEQALAARIERWELSAWLHWFEPSERPWVFWDCRAEDGDTVRLIVVVDGWPYPHGALDWLLRAAGARQVDAED